MRDDDDLTTWVERLKEGDSEAPAVIWERVFDKLVRVCRRKLERQGLERRTRDEEDIAASVIKSVILKARRGWCKEIQNTSDLWLLLSCVAQRKVATKRKYDLAQKRGGSGAKRIKTVGEEAFGDVARGYGIQQVPSTEPTPDFVLMMAEALDGLPARLRKVALLRMEGLGNMEIASKLNVTTRTVDRLLKTIKESWTKTCTE